MKYDDRIGFPGVFMRAALYARVSTDDQAREGFSLDAQVKRMTAYCRVRGWEVADIYRDEGYSGRYDDRPEYTRMMSESDRWDILLVLKMDRIHRNSVNFAKMMDRLRAEGKDFNSMQDKFDTTTAMGRFVMDIMQRIAQLESEQIGERVKLGMTFKAKGGGGHLGSGHPYGYEYSGGSMKVVEPEAAVVRDVFNMRLRGSTYSEIADYLNKSGVPTKRGGTWRPQTVSNMIRNPVYVGYVDWNGIIRKGDQEPVVPMEKFVALNGPLEEKRCARRCTSGSRPRSRPPRDIPWRRRDPSWRIIASQRDGTFTTSTRTTGTPEGTTNARRTGG